MKKIFIPVLYALAVWALCAAVMGIGMATLSMDTTLTIHAFAAPAIAFGISFIYFRKSGKAQPLKTAGIFIAVIVLMDFFVVAMLINKSFDMFGSFIGTWLPFMLIFAATYASGLVSRMKG